MARTFAEVAIEFERTVVQRQTVTVKVDENLSPETREIVARELAYARLKPRGWTDVLVSEVDEASLDPPKVTINGKSNDWLLSPHYQGKGFDE